MKPRRDYETARLIDESIRLMQSHGTYRAARMLCEAGVRLDTAYRVLRRPELRRVYGDAILH